MAQSYKLTVEEICNKLKPVFGDKIDKVYLKYAMAENREEREEIEHILRALYHKHLTQLLDKAVLLEPPTQKDVEGDYPLGIVSYANKQLCTFALREQDWPRHVCISGMSGSGKTTLGFHIINNFIKKNKPFLIFDWKKSFRPLLLADPKLMIFTIGEDVSNLFKININVPPKGVAPKEWINVLADLLTESFSVSFGVHKVILETLDEAYKEWGIYNGSQNYPTWNHIKWRLEEKAKLSRGRESTWFESALRIATVLSFGSFGNIVNYKGEDSMKVEELLDKQVVFELNSLGNIEKKFFCEFVLTYIYKFKKANQKNSNSKFEHAILVDEAHNIFLKNKTSFVQESVTDMIYREMREYGIALICLDQHISKLSDTVKGNSACHIAFQQQLPEDIKDISSMLQLWDRQDYFSRLSVGSAIVKLSERYPSPFLIQIPDVELRKKEVSNAEVKSRMTSLMQLKEVEEGKDEGFRKQLLEDPQFIKKTEVKQEIARTPKHAMYDGELKEIKEMRWNENIYQNELKKKIEDNKGSIKDLIEKHEITPNIIETKPFVNELKIDIEFDRRLNPRQAILYEYVERKLEQSTSLIEIKRTLENNLWRGLYSLRDVDFVLDYTIDNGLRNVRSILRNTSEKSKEIKEIDKIEPTFISVTTNKALHNQKVYKQETNILNTENSNGLSHEQKSFITFLQANPNHNLSTTNVYKQLGLSNRKGNKIKDELSNSGLIKIQEVKYDKGWKKIIRVC